MKRLCLLVFALVLAATVAHAQSGTMIIEGNDPKTGRYTRTKYSKYFDGAGWLIPDSLGASVVVDNDTPVSRQVFGSLTGKDSEAVGTVTVYFWNLEKDIRKATAITVEVGEGKLAHTAEFQIGPKFSRTGHKAGTVTFFAYATTLKAILTVELEGQTIRREITIARRTPAELKKYFGKKGVPPYPWFDENYAIKDDPPEK